MKRVLIALVVMLAAVGSVGWYKYYSFRKATTYALARASFIEEYRTTSQSYAPVTFLRMEGDQMFYQQPLQVIRNGQVFIDWETKSATVTSYTDIFTTATSSPITIADIKPNTPLRIGLSTDQADPTKVSVQTIYVQE